MYLRTMQVAEQHASDQTMEPKDFWKAKWQFLSWNKPHASTGKKNSRDTLVGLFGVCVCVFVLVLFCSACATEVPSTGELAPAAVAAVVAADCCVCVCLFVLVLFCFALPVPLRYHPLGIWPLLLLPLLLLLIVVCLCLFVWVLFCFALPVPLRYHPLGIWPLLLLPLLLLLIVVCLCLFVWVLFCFALPVPLRYHPLGIWPLLLSLLLLLVFVLCLCLFVLVLFCFALPVPLRYHPLGIWPLLLSLLLLLLFVVCVCVCVALKPFLGTSFHSCREKSGSMVYCYFCKKTFQRMVERKTMFSVFLRNRTSWMMQTRQWSRHLIPKGMKPTKMQRLHQSKLKKHAWHSGRDLAAESEKPCFVRTRPAPVRAHLTSEMLCAQNVR